jgi:hypothetical protein
LAGSGGVARLSGTGDAFQRGTVDDRGVTPEAAQQHGPVGSHRVQRRAPVASIPGDDRADPRADPIAGLPGGFGDHGERLFRGRARKGQAGHRQRCRRQAAAEMHMSFDQAGRREPAAGIDDARARPRHRADVGVVAHGAEAPILDRHRFGTGTGRVRGEDLGVDDDQLGRGEGGAVPHRERGHDETLELHGGYSSE